MSYYIPEEQEIPEYSIKNECGSSFSFNSMKEPLQKTFSDKAPEYRKITKGVNFQGTCKNSNCKAYNNKAWAMKGFGKFNMSRQIKRTKCPLCQQNLKDVNNLGIFMCTMKVQGKYTDQEQDFENQYTVRDLKKFLTFKNYDQMMRQWDFLELDVRQ